MENSLENYELALRNASSKIQKKRTDNFIKSNKCNKCDYASSQIGHLNRHLKTHTGEKPNKCNQCDFATSQAGTLRNLLKCRVGKNQTNAINVNHRQAI